MDNTTGNSTLSDEPKTLPGTILGIVWMILVLPVSSYLTIWYHRRRDIQPIKSRTPNVVVLTNIILILYELLICIERLISKDYPCFLNIWGSYIGTIIVANTYLWRCWSLFFTFHLTQQKLLNQDINDLPFFIRNRHYVSLRFFVKFSIVTLVLLAIPYIILTANEYSLLNDLYGDSRCDFLWGRWVLAAYVIAYAIAFLFFAIQLRQVIDGFKIKAELKFTGIVAALAVIPYMLMNEKWRDYNNNVFPYSTLCLLIALQSTFMFSTVWPLYRSIHHPPIISAPDIENLEVLADLIATKEGFNSFRKFLTAEFSVENLLFYSEIEDLRRKIHEGADLNFAKSESRRLFAKYIIVDSPFQLNLPDLIVQGLESKMMTFEEKGIVDQKNWTGDQAAIGHDAIGRLIEIPTIFDEAQRSIYNLMDSDSFPRYKSSEMYREFVELVKDQRHKTTVLKEMQII